MIASPPELLHYGVGRGGGNMEGGHTFNVFFMDPFPYLPIDMVLPSCVYNTINLAETMRPGGWPVKTHKRPIRWETTARMLLLPLLVSLWTGVGALLTDPPSILPSLPGPHSNLPRAVCNWV